MQVNRLIPIILLLLSFSACIEEYKLEDKDQNEGAVVISGTVSDKDGMHYVRVSRSASIANPAFSGISGCTVLLIDDLDRPYTFTESDPGVYGAWLNLDSLKKDRQFRLSVSTPECTEFTTKFKKIPQQGTMGKVYGQRLDKEQGLGEPIDEGVQFYYDYKGNETDSKFYRFEMEETWEYHSKHPLLYEWWGRVIRSTKGTKYSVCYRTKPIHQVYTLNTSGLSKNEIPSHKLNWVSRSTEKFNHKYSLLIKQYALNEADYNYWRAIEENEQESGGLFDKQPQVLKGNIFCASDTTKIALGNFNLVSQTTKRFTSAEKYGLEPYIINECTPYVDEDLGTTPAEDFPVYLVLENGVYKTTSRICFDCTLRGGSIVKPSYW